jgi:propionyl-CoA synthetase
MQSYASVRQFWSADPLGWWLTEARRIDWKKSPEVTRDDDLGPHGAWFPDGLLNTSYNCLDRHIHEGHGGRLAIIWDSPLAGDRRRYTYAELLQTVARFAGALAEAGVGKGDRVLIYMPMVPEAIIAMLATARLGAIHSVVFGGFASAELAKRIDDAKPRVIVSASCGLEPSRIVHYKELLDAAIAISSHSPERCFILQRPTRTSTLLERDRDLELAIAEASPVPAVPVRSTDPLYVLYTSGTSGKPKGIVRDHGGYCVALLASMNLIYGAGGGDVFWAASDIGWVVGHSYIVYGPLLAGCTTVLYEGKPVGTPDAGAFWRVCAEYGVRTLFTAPTAIRSIRKSDPNAALMQDHDLSGLDAVFLAGERCDPPTATWLSGNLDRPVLDHWWQTETGWPVAAGFRGIQSFEQIPGSAGRAVPGWDVSALDDGSQPVAPEADGDLAIRLPLPPGAATTLWNDDAGFTTAYLAARPGWYSTGDAGRMDEAGNVWVLGRIDDIINVAGHRLSTGAMEEVIASHPSVAECAVIAVPDALKGEVPLALFVKHENVSDTDDVLEQALVALVREQIGAVAALKHAILVSKLPKTRSGKIIRKSMRDAAKGIESPIPPTIEDPQVLERVTEQIRAFAGVRSRTDLNPKST